MSIQYSIINCINLSKITTIFKYQIPQLLKLFHMLKMKFKLILFTTILSMSAFSQNSEKIIKAYTYIDALRLNEIYNKVTTSNYDTTLYKIKTILSNYSDSGSLNPKNPFFNNYYKKLVDIKSELVVKENELINDTMKLSIEIKSLDTSILRMNNELQKDTNQFNSIKKMIDTSKRDSAIQLSNSLNQMKLDTLGIEITSLKLAIDKAQSRRQLLQETIKSIESTLNIKTLNSKGISFKVVNKKDINNMVSYDIQTSESIFSDQAILRVPSQASPLGFEAAVINGVSNFMAGRFKQELLNMLINQVYNDILHEKDSVILMKLFPRTHKLVENIKKTKSNSNYTIDFMLLKQTAQKDIENLPKSFVEGIDNILIDKSIKPESKDLIRLGYYIYSKSKNEKRLDHFISSLANAKYSTNDSKIKRLVDITDMLSMSLIDTGSKSNTLWINPTENLDIYSRQPDMKTQLYFGLLLEQLRAIPAFKSYVDTIEKYAKSKQNNIQKSIQTLNNLVSFNNELLYLYTNLKSKDFKITTTEEFIYYLQQFNEAIVTLGRQLEADSILSFNSNHYINVLDHSAKMLSVLESFSKKEYYKAIPGMIMEFSNFVGTNHNLRRKLAFLSQLASITRSDEMENLLNSYALPVGSSSIKRGASFNCSLNGYVGITGGREWDGKSAGENYNFGLTAPIGFSFSLLIGNKSNWSFFCSLLDLGTMVNKRLNGDNTDYPGLKVEQFLAPGAGLYYNFQNIPITFGVHYFPYIPSLRSIRSEPINGTSVETNLNISRLNLSLLIDIPFFTIYNKDKK